MPTYIYRCNDCGHEFEVRQRMSDDSLTECPVCSGTVRRIVGSVGIVFKGSGFYVTDNRNSNGKGRVQTTEKKAEDNKESKKDSGESESKKSDSKPDKKKD